MVRRRFTLAWALMGALALLGACQEAQEAPRVTLEVVADPSGLEGVETDLGYTVTVTEARVAVADLALTVAGEAHVAALEERLEALWLPRAHAHPGHAQGGEVTGELRGRLLVDWTAGAPLALGSATLITGGYESANFAFRLADVDDGLAAGDPLLGHTAILSGVAVRGGVEVPFTVLLDAPEDRQLIGAPFEATITEATQASATPIGLRLLTRDPSEGDTLFDGVDFAQLADAEGQLKLDESSPDAAQEAYFTLRRAFLSHDHFDLRLGAPSSASETAP